MNEQEVDKDLQQIINAVADVVTTGIKQLSDGFQYTDLFAFVPVLSEIPEAIKDAANAWHWLKDMNEEKRSSLINAVMEKLGETSEKVRNLVTRIIDAAASVYMLATTVVHYND